MTLTLTLTSIAIGYSIYLAAAYFGYIPPSYYNITHKAQGYEVVSETPLCPFYIKMHDGYFETIEEAEDFALNL